MRKKHHSFCLPSLVFNTSACTFYNLDNYGCAYFFCLRRFFYLVPWRSDEEGFVHMGF